MAVTGQCTQNDMRLYLSSFGIGNQPEQLPSLVGSRKQVAVIMNALDHRQQVRDKFLASESTTLTNLGFIVEELDLRKYFGKQKELSSFLATKDLVWVTGGNTFILRRAMKESGFDYEIIEALKKDVLVYGGFSAGVVVLSPDLHGLDITDNPHEVPAGYSKEIIWEGLGILDFSVAVHYQSDHSESALTDKEIEYYKAHNIPYKTLRDGQVMIRNQEDFQVIE